MPSYGEVVHSDLRVQAPLGGGNNTMSRCRGGSVDWSVKLQGVRTLVQDGRVAYIEYAYPLQPLVTQGFNES